MWKLMWKSVIPLFSFLYIIAHYFALNFVCACKEKKEWNDSVIISVDIYFGTSKCQDHHFHKKSVPCWFLSITGRSGQKLGPRLVYPSCVEILPAWPQGMFGVHIVWKEIKSHLDEWFSILSMPTDATRITNSICLPLVRLYDQISTYFTDIGE